MRSWLTPFALLVAVASLAAWLFYYKPPEMSGEPVALSALKPGDVKRARFERAAQAAAHGAAKSASGFTIERRDGEWRMREPIEARVDHFHVERLLSILEARSAVRMEPSEPARFGLDRPFATLTLEDQTFVYGAINTATREQYVMTRNAVYLVPLAYSAALPRNADAMLSKQLFGPGEVPLRFELPGFSVALQDGTWTLTPPSEEVGADERNAWVQAWRQAAAISAARAVVGATEEAVKVTLKDERTISIGILQRTPDVVLVRRDEGVEYHFFTDAGRRLLAPPSAEKRERVNK